MRINSTSRCSIPTQKLVRPRPTSKVAAKTCNPLFEAIVSTIPIPKGDPAGTLQILVANLDYSDYLGRLAIARVFNGTMRTGERSRDRLSPRRLDPQDKDHKAIFVFRLSSATGTLLRQNWATSSPVAGVSSITIGDNHSPMPKTPAPLPSHIAIDEPTIAMLFTVNTSPFAGKEGTYVTSRNLRERLQKELLTNVSLRVEDTGTTDSFKVLGRGELQLSILIEMMRREGYELMVGKPEIVTKRIDGKLMEPVERSPPSMFPKISLGVVMEQLGSRKGEVANMHNHGYGRVRVEFRVPSRGLIGLRSTLLTDTRGTIVKDVLFDGYTGSVQGDIPHRLTGALIADRNGVSTAYALWGLQERGELFVGPGIELYEGMLIGENAKDTDLDVNAVREKKLTNMRASTADEAIRLVPFRPLNLEQAIEFIADDEFVEITPKSLRLRKKVLQSNQRKKKSLAMVEEG